jgi:glycosyltransferase involved in cell wall biosynthesis
VANQTDVVISTPRKPVTGVSIIIPCKDEEEGIAQTINEIHGVFAPLDYDYELLVIDDGSTDGSSDIALSSGAHVLRHEMNMGYGNSIMDGIKAARFESIAIIDADGTYPALILPEMLKRLETCNMVVGARLWQEENTTLMALLFRKLLYYVILYLTSVKAPDFNSGLRVFWKKEIELFWGLLCPTFSFTTTMSLLYLITQRQVLFLPIQYFKRQGRSKVHYLRDAIRTLTFVLLIANLFKVYRLVFMLVLSMFAVEVFVAILLGIAGASLATVLACHLAVIGAYIIVMLAFIAMPQTVIYRESLHRHIGQPHD